MAANAYRVLFEEHPHAMWIFDQETMRFLAVNGAAVLEYGYSREEFLGMSILDVHPPEELSVLRECLRGLRASERLRRCRHLTKDGRILAVEVTSHALRFEGRPARLVSAHDVTAREAATDALRQANLTLRALIEASPLAIVALDFDGNVKSWNPAATRMFGWTEEDVLGRPFPIIPAEDMEFFRTNVYRARSGATVSGVERKRLRKDGSLVDVSLWNAVQRDASGTPAGVISVIADITERKRLEEQLRQSQKIEAIGRLAGGVAHDFNNLMTVITGFGQLVLDSLPQDNPLHPQVEEVVKAGNRAAALTNQLLAIGRRQMIRPRILDLNYVISEIEPKLRRMLPGNIELAVTLERDLGRIHVDRKQIEEVLANLTANAGDAMPDGGRLEIATSNFKIDAPEQWNLPDLRPDWYALLRVSDTGHGMDEETRRQVFEPFFTTKELGRGAGLGLSTVYGIVKQNGGEVVVVSQPGCGTTFQVYFPQAGCARETSGQPAELAPALRGCETVLLVDDEPGVRHLTREMLRRQGYTVLEASGGREALRIFKKHQGSIDLLLTDVIMPQMSGRKLSEEIHKLAPALKVLYMSAYAEHVLVERDAPAFPASFLHKPFTAEDLAIKLREALGPSTRQGVEP